MTLRDWLDKRINSIRKLGYEPLDIYRNQYREGYVRACHDVRDLLGKAGAAPQDSVPASTTEGE